MVAKRENDQLFFGGRKVSNSDVAATEMSRGRWQTDFMVIQYAVLERLLRSDPIRTLPVWKGSNWRPMAPSSMSLPSRQWPEIYDLCHTIFTLRQSKSLRPFENCVRFLHGRRLFWLGQRAKTCEKIWYLGYQISHCLLPNIYIYIYIYLYIYI